MADNEIKKEDIDASEMNSNDENVTEVNHPIDSVTEESVIEKLNAQLEEEKKKYLYLFADFDNFKRRSSKERLELIQTAGKEVIQSLLEVLDDTDRAEAELNKSGYELTGVRLVFQKLRSTLQNRGLKAMEVKGLEFDADRHEAITEIPAPTEDLIGKIVDEVEKGYLLNDKIIRFAKVVVGK
jgi:molecular chaperone GrpE